MRALLLIILAAIFLTPVSLRAQQMNAADSPCKNAGSDMDTTSCFIREYHQQHQRLNASYQSILKVLDAKNAASLKAAQRLWLQFRDAECKAESDLYEGGTARPAAEAACLEAITRRRVRELGSGFGWIRDK